MDAAASQRALTEYAESLIRYKARKLATTRGFTSSDMEDIEQDLRTALLEAYPTYDRNRATYATFVATVVRNAISSMIRHRTQACRDYRKEEYSLQEKVQDGEGKAIERGQQLDGDQCAIRRGLRCRTRQDQAALKMDVDAVVAGLPNDLRKVADLLKVYPVAEAARRLHVPRSTLYSAISQLRVFFEAAGFGTPR